MLDGLPLIDAHLHPARLPTLKPAWLDWAVRYGQPSWQDVYDGEGTIIPAAFDALLAAEGADRAILLCEYSPKVTGIQPAEELLPIITHNPGRFAFLANINPHLHYPVADEAARQVALGAVGLKVHPVHAGVSAADPMLYPAYHSAPPRACRWWCTAAPVRSLAPTTRSPRRTCCCQCCATFPG